MKDIRIAISGMSCSHCMNAVNRALTGVTGIEVRTVQMGRAELRVPDTGDAATAASSAIEAAGYKVEGITPA